MTLVTGITHVINISTLPARQRALLLDPDGYGLPGHVYIGRSSFPQLGQWGNKYVFQANSRFTREDGIVRVRNRQEAIARYSADKWGEPGFLHRCRVELKGKVLVCFCKPLPCHGDLLAKWAES